MATDVELSSLSSAHSRLGLEERALAGCLRALKLCAQEDEEVEEVPLAGFQATDFVLRCDWQAVVFYSHYFRTPLFETTIGIYLSDPTETWRDSLEPVGVYRDYTELDGTDYDDVLDLDYELLKHIQSKRQTAPNTSVPGDRDPRERGSRPLNTDR